MMLFLRNNKNKTGIKWFDDLVDEYGLEDSIGMTEQAWMEECVSTADLLKIYDLTDKIKNKQGKIRKKKIKISGVPIGPIEVGDGATISEERGIRQTSEVIKLTTVSKRRIRFETRNTRYCLHLTGKPKYKEADAI